MFVKLRVVVSVAALARRTTKRFKKSLSSVHQACFSDCADTNYIWLKMEKPSPSSSGSSRSGQQIPPVPLLLAAQPLPAAVPEKEGPYTNREWTGLLLREAGSPSYYDKVFPKDRYNDFYEGFGWLSGGINPLDDGLDQESESEVAHFSLGIFRFGAATNDDALAVAGKMRFLMHARSVRTYKQVGNEIAAEREVHEKPFSAQDFDASRSIMPFDYAQKVLITSVSRMADTGTWTWFGPGIANTNIHAINNLPLTAWTIPAFYSDESSALNLAGRKNVYTERFATWFAEMLRHYLRFDGVKASGVPRLADKPNCHGLLGAEGATGPACELSRLIPYLFVSLAMVDANVEGVGSWREVVEIWMGYGETGPGVETPR